MAASANDLISAATQSVVSLSISTWIKPAYLACVVLSAVGAQLCGPAPLPGGIIRSPWLNSSLYLTSLSAAALGSALTTAILISRCLAPGQLLSVLLGLVLTTLLPVYIQAKTLNPSTSQRYSPSHFSCGVINHDSNFHLLTTLIYILR